MADDSKDIDLGVLDGIISRCEQKMVSPWKKKPEPAAEPEPEAAAPEGKPDLEDMDLQDLMRMYEDVKGK